MVGQHASLISTTHAVHLSGSLRGDIGKIFTQQLFYKFRSFAVAIRLNLCVQAVNTDLDKCKEQLAAATAAADSVKQKHSAAETAARRAASKQQQRLAAVGHAVKAVGSLLLACLAAMASSAAVLQQHTQEAAATRDREAAAREQAEAADASGDDSSGAAAAAAAMVASGLADMVCLSHDELADLLGAEDETCRLLTLANGPADHDTSSHHSAAASTPNGSRGQLLLLGDSKGMSPQHRHLQQQLEDAVEQLVTGDAAAENSSSKSRSDSTDAVGFGQWQEQQQHGVLKGLLVHSVVLAFSEEAAARQEQLRAAAAEVMCTC